MLALKMPIVNTLHIYVVHKMGHFDLEIIGASGSGHPLMDCIRIAQNELVKWLVDDSNLASATPPAAARRPLLTGA